MKSSSIRALAILLPIVACTNTNFGNDNVFSTIDALDSVRNADLSPRNPRGGEQARLTGGADQGAGSTTVYPGAQGSGSLAGRPVMQAADNGRKYDLNLEGALIDAAAKVVLSDILKSGYTIDPRVNGKVSLTTGRPVPVKDLVSYFENALQFAGAALSKDSLGYRIIPISEATNSPSIDRSPQGEVRPGYGVSVIPLQYVSADTIQPLLESFVVRQGLIKVDKSRNLFLVQGTAEERRAAMDAIMSFDQEWLENQSVAVFRVKSTNPEILIREVGEILENKNGERAAGLVKMVAVERLNAVMVVAKSKAYLEKTLTWLNRLDQNDIENVGIRVYQVQYADAVNLASTLNSMLLGGATMSVSRAPDAASQFPPDSGQAAGADTGALGGANAQGSQAAQAPAEIPPVSAGSGNALLENVRISADPANNTILVYADNERYKIIERAIAALDRRPQQVAIEATIAEITLNNELKHGVQFFLKSKDIGLHEDHGSIGLIGAGVDAVLDRVVPGFNMLLGPENEPRLVIDALRGLTEVNVLSQPSLVVRDNTVATLQIGDQVPITTQTARTVDETNAPIVNSISFRDTGVILHVRPRISANGVVGLEIKQEISSVVENSASASLTPTISQRKVESALSVVSGQTVLLGGLISQKKNNGASGLPVLGDLHVLGDLFRSRKTTVNRTELIILIRPRVIRDEYDASSVAVEMSSKLQLLNSRNTVTPLRVPAISAIE